MRFENNYSIKIEYKETLSIYGKLPTQNVYYVEGLKHYLLSVS